MSFRDCVEASVKAGRITREQAEDLFTRQRDATDRFTLDPQHSPESAARMAAELGVERAKQDVRLRKYQAALQAIKNAANTNNVQAYKYGPTLGVRTILERDSRGAAQWTSVNTLAVDILGAVHSRMAEGISQLRTRWFGLSRNNALLDKVINELAGEATGDIKAKTFAMAWAKGAEDLRLRFNRAGGAIRKLSDWIAPQTHDPVLVGKVSKAEWIDDVMGWVNIERMTDVSTGAAFTPDALRLVLDGVNETIRTNGLSDMVPGTASGGTKLANRRQEARFLIFKDAASWKAYQAKYGSQNLYGTLMDHLKQMSHEVALLETLGPNPDASFKLLQDVARKTEDKPIARQTNEAVWRLTNGTGDANTSSLAAHVFGAIRAWNVVKYLGSASLSAVSDLGFLNTRAKWAGLPVTKILGRYLSQLNPANEADRILATRIGITALSWTEAYSNVGRFSELEGLTGGFWGKTSHAGNKLAEVTLRASGLNAMTDAGKRAFVMEFSANLAENFSKPLGEVEEKFRQTLTARGMTAEEWDVLRQTPLTEHKGAKFFTVDQLIDREDLPLSKRQALAARIQSTLNEETRFAVPEPDALARVWTTGFGMPRGSIAGEIGRTVTQFKSFPIAAISLHLQQMRYARAQRGGAAAASYAANLIIGTTIMGMVAMQLKLISKGQDPRDMEDQKAWGAAFVQGGGAGIFGDFLFSDVNRFGSGLTSTLLGPTAGEADALARLSLGNVQQLMKGEDANVAADAVGYLSRYTPGGNLWYSRLVLEREVFDQLAEAADPGGARKRFKRKEKRARDQGGDYWWRPGQTEPSRAPQMGEQ